ncbi:MAG TPA: anaerobic ribonucleoside-triphosphate reductase [Spirochaetota bacterium]|nr:anaerobic ribonucleoside-triphosphate reductase [Spirochaetota bacterium]
MKKVPVEVYSRVVGYYRPVNQWNRGKQEEFAERREFHITNETTGTPASGLNGRE